VTAFGTGVENSFRLWCVIAALDAIKTVAEPRATAIPAKGAGELPSVALAGLVWAGHDTVVEP
jgi:hypothetical protein